MFNDKSGIKNKKIVLFFPNLTAKELRAFPSYWQRVPLQLLSLARMFNPEEYSVTIIDAKMEEDVESRVLNEVSGSICFGVSAIIGNQLVEGFKISKLVKDRYPDIPIIWGGWFPSIEPEITVANPYIDFVVRGQGELTFLELVENLAYSREIKDVLGITYKINGNVMSNPQRPVEDINKFPQMPYHFLDIKRYLSVDNKKNVRHINFLSSVGCPYQCIFCADNLIYERNWIALKPDRVVDELETLVNGWGVTHVAFDDPTFFINKQRTKQICEMIIERGLAGKFLWYVTGNADRVARLDNEELELISKSGLTEIFIGAESGSPATLKLLRKNITIEDILKSAEILRKHNILCIMSFITGTPVEADGDLDKTIDLAYKITQINPNTQFLINLFSAIPRIAALDLPDAKKMFKEPTSLEGWIEAVNSIDYRKGKAFFKDKKYLTKVSRFRFSVLATDRLHRLYINSKNPALKKIYIILRGIQLYRLKHRFFYLPIELYLKRMYLFLFPTGIRYSLSFTDTEPQNQSASFNSKDKVNDT